jgi:hypothetical protein
MARNPSHGDPDLCSAKVAKPFVASGKAEIPRLILNERDSAAQH